MWIMSIPSPKNVGSGNNQVALFYIRLRTFRLDNSIRASLLRPMVKAIQEILPALLHLYALEGFSCQTLRHFSLPLPQWLNQVV